MRHEGAETVHQNRQVLGPKVRLEIQEVPDLVRHQYGEPIHPVDENIRRARPYAEQSEREFRRAINRTFARHRVPLFRSPLAATYDDVHPGVRR